MFIHDKILPNFLYYNRKALILKIFEFKNTIRFDQLITIFQQINICIIKKVSLNKKKVFKIMHSFEFERFFIFCKFYFEIFFVMLIIVIYNNKMMINLTSILIFVSVFSCACSSGMYRLELYSQDKGASCLDGSPPGLYILPGTTNKDKFIIFFDGGGFCAGTTVNETIQACYKRSFGELGSTKNYPQEIDGSGYGVLSPNESENPVFFDWTKVFVIYCDGSEYIGNRDEPIKYKERNLYFRGSKNAMQTFNHLDKHYDFYNKQTIVITGISAGGMAAFEWSNYVFQNTKSSKVLSLPDSGFFITDYYSPIVRAKVLRLYAENLLKLVYEDKYIPQHIKKCLQKPNFDIVDCVNAGNYAEFLKAPTFIIESPYDEYSLDDILFVDCLSGEAPCSLQYCNETTRKAIEDYRLASIQYLQGFKTKMQNVGIWGPACVQHGFSAQDSFTSKNFEVNGVTLAQAVQMFLDNPESPPWLLDTISWPGNKGCSGMQKRLRTK